jgi:hypothetical protein
MKTMNTKASMMLNTSSTISVTSEVLHASKEG